MSSEGGSFSHVSCHVGADWRVRCNACPDTTPILSFDAGSPAVSVTAKGSVAGKTAVKFARALAREAGKFAAEMERMHAAQLDGDGESAGHDAA